VIPQEFTVDNFQNIPNPIGYSGVKSGSQFPLSSPATKIAIRNINRSVEKSRIAYKGPGAANHWLPLQPLWHRKTWRPGVAIVDIGGWNGLTLPFFMKEY
jgi:cell division protein FtsA